GRRRRAAAGSTAPPTAAASVASTPTPARRSGRSTPPGGRRRRCGCSRRRWCSAAATAGGGCWSGRKLLTKPAAPRCCSAWSSLDRGRPFGEGVRRDKRGRLSLRMRGHGMRKRWLGVAAALVAAGVGAALLEPTCTAWGVLRGESFYRGRPTTYWAGAVRTGDDATKAKAEAQLKEGGAAALPVLTEMLGRRSGNWEATDARLTAAKLIGQIGPDARSALPDLVAALDDPDPHLRALAVTARGEMGEGAADRLGPHPQQQPT